MDNGEDFCKDSLSSSQFVKRAFERKKQKRSHLPIRLLATKGDFNASALSRILSGERSVSLEMADRLFPVLDLSSYEHYYLKNLILYETSKNEEIKESLSLRLLSGHRKIGGRDPQKRVHPHSHSH